jgi:hypothetical protein
MCLLHNRGDLIGVVVWTRNVARTTEIGNAYRISAGKFGAMNFEDVFVDDIEIEHKGTGCKSEERESTDSK